MILAIRILVVKMLYVKIEAKLQLVNVLQIILAIHM